MSNIGAYEYKAQHNGNFHWIIGKNYWNIYSPSSDVNLNDYFNLLIILQILCQTLYTQSGS